MELITVDKGTLSKGLKTAFTGVAMIFDSLGGEAEGISGAVEEAFSGKGEGEAPAPVAVEQSAPVENEVQVSAGPGEAAGEEAADVPEEETKPKALTLDDITRIIVKKIEGDQAYKDKIGALVQAYGVEKVRDLPVEKYEAFVMDLSVL